MASDEIGKLRVLLSAQTAEYIAEVKKARAETAAASKDIKSEGGVGGINVAFQKLIAAGVVAKAGQMLVQFGADSIKAASDVEESMSKARVVFGESMGGVEEDLGAFADAAGRSQYELIGFAATLQDTFVPLGFARQEAADLSVAAVKLAEDLASFNNLRTADVVRDIQSALVGNTETVRKYGVVAQETQIKQEALNSGLWDGTGAIDAQAKAQAIYQLILKGTTDAQGDAIRTSDSLANKQKELEASMLDLKVAIGDELTPATAGLIQGLIDAADAAELLVTWGDRLAQAVDEQHVRVKQTATTYEEYVQGVLAANVASGRLDQSWVNLHGSAVLAGTASKLLTDDLELLTVAEFNAYQAALALEESELKLATARAGGNVLMEKSAEEISDLMFAQEALNQQLEDLQLFISGPLGKEIDSYTENIEELKLEQVDLLLKIDELENKQYLTTAQKQELEGLREALGQNQEEMDKTATAHEEATKRILFDLLVQRAAIDEVSAVEYKFLSTVALQWGLVDQATYDATIAMDQALTELNESENWDIALGLIQGIDAAVRRIPTHVTINIDVAGSGVGYQPTGAVTQQQNVEDINAEGDGAEGLDHKVPGGYPADSYRMRLNLTSNERVLVLTEEQQRNFGRSSSVTNRNVYINELHVHTNDGRSVLAEMQAYANLP